MLRHGSGSPLLPKLPDQIGLLRRTLLGSQRALARNIGRNSNFRLSVLSAASHGPADIADTAQHMARSPSLVNKNNSSNSSSTHLGTSFFARVFAANVI
ncbi:hypothetical protein IF1G_07169 [Cordyceps javanica]|uniref:Uncharacterized protein n=1 Tax=Cordyceps javanica TaxID=43265 RepID=A0A545UXU2_9HYPO|nr:hypothetical protein IF1G_07169 [Cordyceps javanica]